MVHIGLLRSTMIPGITVITTSPTVRATTTVLITATATVTADTTAEATTWTVSEEETTM